MYTILHTHSHILCVKSCNGFSAAQYSLFPARGIGTMTDMLIALGGDDNAHLVLASACNALSVRPGTGTSANTSSVLPATPTAGTQCFVNTALLPIIVRGNFVHLPPI